jgi:secreted trypsin-like serine protease
VDVLPTVKPPGSAINGQIIGGTKATAGQAPYQVNLIMDNVSLCGGSLISKQWILTAAHCLNKYDILLARVFQLWCKMKNKRLSLSAKMHRNRELEYYFKT